MNSDELMGIRSGIRTGPDENAGKRKNAAEIWSVQVDAAALVDADGEIRSGGGARYSGRREEEEEKAMGGK